MKIKKKVTIEYISINKQGTKDEYISIDSATFDYPEDALAFWNSLSKDRRVTERSDIPIKDDVDCTDNADSAIYKDIMD